MPKIIMFVSFELNNPNLLNDWKTLSAIINDDLQGVDGFISRDSAQGKDGTIYCILKWHSQAQQEAFRASLEARPEWPQMMEDFGRIVNLDTMAPEVLEVF